MNHYTYILKSNTQNKFYIGVRSCSCPISEDNYMGSSKAMSAEDKNSCIKVVLKTFNTREEAVAHEVYLHNKHNVNSSDLFWNVVKQTTTKFDTTGNKEVYKKVSASLKGHKLSEETKDKIRKKAIGRSPSEETRKKLAEAGRNREVSESTREKLSKIHKGKTVSEEEKQRLKQIASGTSSGAFNPWWFELDGYRIVVNDMTITEFAKWQNISYSAFSSFFCEERKNKVVKKGLFKGYKFGLVKDDVVMEGEFTE